MRRSSLKKKTWFKREAKKKAWLSSVIRASKGQRSAYKEEKWRKAVRERDKHSCKFPECSFRSKSIDAHHIATRSRRPDLKFVVENGIALCRQHHTWVHNNPLEASQMGLLSEESYEKAKRVA